MLYYSNFDNVPYRYGLDELPLDITKRELLYFFSLTQEEKELAMGKNRSSTYSVVIGIQLGAYRFIGRPQINPKDTPYMIIKFVAENLNIEWIPSGYSNSERTYREHAQIAREFLGLSRFTVEQHQTLLKYLIEQSPDPGNIFDWIKCAEDFLRAHHFVLPTVKVLRRLILSARHQSIEKVMVQITSQMDDECKNRMEEILISKDNVVPFWNSVIDKNIYNATPKKLSHILERIKNIRQLSLKQIDLNSIPYQHIKYLARQGMHISAYELKDYSLLRKYSIMVITLRELESELTDICIQMNDEILAGVFQRGKKRSEKYLRKYRNVIYQVVSAYRFMSDNILDKALPPDEIIKRIKDKIPPEKLQALREETDFIDIPRGSESLYFASQGHGTIQKYFPVLLETFKILSPSKKDPIIEAADYYAERRREGKKGIGQDAPTKFIQEARWKRIVFDSKGKIKAKPWVLCLADKLRKSFRQGALEIEGTRQYRSLNSDLIAWKEWNAIEIKRDNNLPFTFKAEEAFSSLSCAIKDFSKNLKKLVDKEPTPATIDDKNRLHLTKLDKIEEPDSAKELHHLLQKRMPQYSLSDVLAEVDRFIGYSKYFIRLSTGQSVQEDEESIGHAVYALILAAACNIPLSKIAISTELSVSSLQLLREDIFRPQTIQSATAALVDFHSRLPLSQIWGGGETSSSDGQGFAAAGNPLGSGYNPYRFERKRKGFIIYTHILDNYAPFYTQVIPASAREATYVLNGLLYHGSSLIPREHYTDSHGYTDIVFALTYLLGFRLAPRMANVPDLTLWYGKEHEVELIELFDGRISLQTISDQWETIQRIVKTIQSGRVPASQIIRKISSFSRKHQLFKAFRNLGRLVRTRHILEIAIDKEYRQRILQGLNKGEAKNSLANELRYARRGIIREKDPEMQISVASSMNLAILCIAVWNTIYMQRKIRSLAQKGYKIDKEDLRFLSPFTHSHINLYGKFSFYPLPKKQFLPLEKEFEPLW